MIIKTIEKSINVNFSEEFAEFFFTKIVEEQIPFKLMGTDKELRDFSILLHQYAIGLDDDIYQQWNYYLFINNLWYKYDEHYNYWDIDTLKEELKIRYVTVIEETKKIKQIDNN